MSVHQSIHRCTNVQIIRSTIKPHGTTMSHTIELIIEQDDSDPTRITLFSDELLAIEENKDE